ncbi:MAG: 5-bromo-4-chloroindolyl phosphate hydrolysis family protein [Oscillospiraceae bacterium]|nr:5-bromo-4-chloroindolyl phosphate hydrolysis family protein [Oscillospiraceae bacterium]
MKEFNYNKSERTYDIIFGAAAIALSSIISLLFLVAGILSMAANLTTGLIGRFLGGAVANRLMELFQAHAGDAGKLIMCGAAFGLVWTVIGIKALLRVQRANRYAKIFTTQPSGVGRVKIAEIVKQTGYTLKRVSHDLNTLKKRGYFPTINFDLDNKEAIFVENSEPLVQIGNESATVYKENREIPLVPIAAAVVTLISFSFGWWLFSVTTAIGAGLLTTMFFPLAIYFSEVKRTTPKMKKPSATGNSDLDEVLAGIYENKKELVRLKGSIVSPKIRTPLADIIRVSEQISQYVTDNPEKAKSLRQFCNYYLPTTVNFLATYEELESKSDKGENIMATLAKIEEVTAKLVDVFKREYDELFADKVMDIEAETSVMKAIIAEADESKNI